VAIKLTNFLEFEPFLVLRKKMQATDLGGFEIFNPQYHLTGVERSELERNGLILPRHQIAYLLDFTLAYKNSRVMVLDERYYHLSYCNEFPDTSQLFVTTDHKLEPHLSVCPHCLARLHYKGYDPLKARKEAYSRQVEDLFNIDEFWHQYPIYPVSEKRDIRRYVEE
jgi:hypothetical protein